jgi:hypothetical protein
MAKCNRCGKKGFFLKVSLNGLCIDCERIEKLQKEEHQIHEKISKLNKDITTKESSIRDLEINRENIYKEILDQAKKDALFQVKNEIDNKNLELQNVTNKLGEEQKSLEEIIAENNSIQKSSLLFANKLKRMQTLFKSIQYSTQKYYENEGFEKGVIEENSNSEVEEILSTTVKLKLHLMDIRELRKLYNQNNKIILDLLKKYQERYTTKANATIYKLMVIALESELQNIMYNLNYSKLEKSIKDLRIITNKYQKIATEGNQSIASTVNKFIGEIEYLFIEAIKIEYEYYIQKERIKEEQKSIRDRMRQEAAERKLLEEERKKVAQEEEKYKTEIINIKEQISITENSEKLKQLEERIETIKSQLGEVEKKKEDITKLQHGQAGYIYIISNLGSFGDNVFKIGMTRRIDPQERVDELGDASVPFRFDVHSLIFSNNASDLETKLHKQLNRKRVNKINLRKEFFNTTIDELEDLVYSLEPSAEFNRTMLADQYYKSMAVEEVPDNIDIIEDENFDDDQEQIESVIK